MTTIDTTVRRQELGEALRAWRKEANLTLEEASRVINCSQSKLSRVETGQRSITPVEVSALLAVYKADSRTRDRLLALAEESGEIGWWQRDRANCLSGPDTLITVEAKAECIVHFDVTLVPGILQTSEYTQAVLTESQIIPEDEIQDRMHMRLRRNSVLLRYDPPELVAIIDELALHRVIGGCQVQRRQLECLVQESRRRNVTLRVLPNNGCAHSGIDGSFIIVRRSECSPVVLVESLTSGLFLEDRREVGAYESIVRNLLNSALSEEESVAMIADLAKRLGSEESDGWSYPTYPC